MTENEAIKVLEKPSKHIRMVHKTKNEMEFYTFSSDLVESFEMAIQALEKQTPKKPCRISEIDENDNALVECPICHAGNDYAINRIKSGYCWNCGQKLDWETDC